MSAYISNVPEVEQGTEPYFDGVNRLLSKEWNVGLDFGLFNDRVNLAVKYYDKNTEDIFRMYNFGVILSDLWVKTPDWKLEHERMSSLRNNGFELDAAFRIIDAKNVKWTAGFNVAYNINSVVTLDETDNNVLGRIDAPYLTANMQGSTIGQVLGKDTLPKVCSGLRTALSVYGVTLDARFSGASEFNIINFNNFVEDYATVMMDKYIEKGDYFRLDHLSLAYDIPVKVKWMPTLRVNLAAHNLFTVTDYSGWTPDVNSFGVNARSYGVDYGSFPLRRSVVLGINLRF
jgi:hypothetical protein